MNKKRLAYFLAFACSALPLHAEDSEATRLLKERSEYLKPLITKVSPSVHVASGYSPANISMIVGTDGGVIVDTGMVAPHAEAVLKDRNIFIGNPLLPTEVFRDGRKKIAVAGLDLELVAAPGEKADQLYVWFPKERVVFTGDNFYQSWPNLYAIRGTAYRDVQDWIHSLDAMLKEKPVRAVPGHTHPIIGEELTTEVLTNYRDAIQHVFDKTIEGINQGMTPDQLVHAVDLPDHLLTLNPDDQTIRTLKAEALEALAEKLITATGRNYYLTVAQELRKPVTE